MGISKFTSEKTAGPLGRTLTVRFLTSTAQSDADIFSGAAYGMAGNKLLNASENNLLKFDVCGGIIY
jgi:hypothetical protein